VEFWIEGEKYVFDKSFVLYIPAGVVHCPFTLHMEDSFFHYTIGPGGEYV
jgi:hypothetical protein